jgi:hypothetical protein
VSYFQPITASANVSQELSSFLGHFADSSNSEEVNMETSAIAGIALQMTQSSQREGISMLMMKQSAEAGQKMAGMLENLAAQQKPDLSFNVSLYA